MITGSAMAGEVLPPHFQISADAKSPDQMRLQNEMILFMPQGILGKVDCAEERSLPLSFGMNAKGNYFLCYQFFAFVVVDNNITAVVLYYYNRWDQLQ